MLQTELGKCASSCMCDSLDILHGSIFILLFFHLPDDCAHRVRKEGKIKTSLRDIAWLSYYQPEREKKMAKMLSRLVRFRFNFMLNFWFFNFVRSATGRRRRKKNKKCNFRADISDNKATTTRNIFRCLPYDWWARLKWNSISVSFDASALKKFPLHCLRRLKCNIVTNAAGFFLLSNEMLLFPSLLIK